MSRPHGAPRDIPPPLELACLQALWALGQGSVSEVRHALKRELAYTTVMTVLGRLEKRGIVARNKQGRHFIYIPKVSRETMRHSAVKELVATFFDSSESALLSYLRRPEGFKAE
jgi:BlaI family transcriptional regulator, penicillinase repressor